MTAPTVLALDDALVALARAWADSPERDTVEAAWRTWQAADADIVSRRLGRLVYAVAWHDADDVALRLEGVDRCSRALDRCRTGGEHVLCCDAAVCQGRRACERCEAHHADLLADALLSLRHLLSQGRGREELDALDRLAGAA